MPGISCDADPVRRDDEDYLHSYARLCFAKMDLNDIEQGAELFLQCLRSYIKVEVVD